MSEKTPDQPPFTATDILRAGTAYLERFRKRGRIEWGAHLVALIAAYVAVIGSESLPAGSGQRVLASSSSSQSNDSDPSFRNRLTKLSTLRAYISLACTAPLLARFSGPAMVTPSTS